jgi:Meiotically Up-regulated Gene 113 (MUG113) protein
VSDLLTIDEAAGLQSVMTLDDHIEAFAGEWVYFMYCAGMVKIGYSRSLARRIVKMRTDMPHPFELIHADEGGPKTERMLHREFAELRVRGEWFKADKKIFDHIRRRRIVRGIGIDRVLPDEPAWVEPREWTS